MNADLVAYGVLNKHYNEVPCCSEGLLKPDLLSLHPKQTKNVLMVDQRKTKQIMTVDMMIYEIHLHD